MSCGNNKETYVKRRMRNVKRNILKHTYTFTVKYKWISVQSDLDYHFRIDFDANNVQYVCLYVCIFMHKGVNKNGKSLF